MRISNRKAEPNRKSAKKKWSKNDNTFECGGKKKTNGNGAQLSVKWKCSPNNGWDFSLTRSVCVYLCASPALFDRKFWTLLRLLRPIAIAHYRLRNCVNLLPTTTSTSISNRPLKRRRRVFYNIIDLLALFTWLLAYRSAPKKRSVH